MFLWLQWSNKCIIMWQIMQHLLQMATGIKLKPYGIGLESWSSLWNISAKMCNFYFLKEQSFSFSFSLFFLSNKHLIYWREKKKEKKKTTSIYVITQNILKETFQSLKINMKVLNDFPWWLNILFICIA